MMACRQAVELISKALDTPLTWREQLALRLHLWLCAMCRRYARQLQLLERLYAMLRAEESAGKPLLLPEGSLSPQARKRILATLHREL